MNRRRIDEISFKIYTLAITFAYYPIYLSILAVDKIKQKLDLD